MSNNVKWVFYSLSLSDSWSSQNVAVSKIQRLRLGVQKKIRGAVQGRAWIVLFIHALECFWECQTVWSTANFLFALALLCCDPFLICTALSREFSPTAFLNTGHFLPKRCLSCPLDACSHDWSAGTHGRESLAAFFTMCSASCPADWQWQHFPPPTAALAPSSIQGPPWAAAVWARLMPPLRFVYLHSQRGSIDSCLSLSLSLTLEFGPGPRPRCFLHNWPPYAFPSRLPKASLTHFPPLSSWG